MSLPGAGFGQTDDREIIQRFRWYAATSPETARTANELKPFESPRWLVLQQKGWIRETDDARFYLNDRIVPKLWRERHPVAYPLIAFAVIAAAAALIHYWSA